MKTKEKAMTWEDLAEWYDKNIGGRKARTLPMEKVFEVCIETGKFEEQKDGSIVLK
jgi:hypothetical protein